MELAVNGRVHRIKYHRSTANIYDKFKCWSGLQARPHILACRTITPDGYSYVDPLPHLQKTI